MKEFVNKLIAKLEELKSLVPVNRVLDNIIESKPKELGQLIAYEKSIKAVNELAEEYKLLENIEQLNNGWIPCSERLPKKSGKYLITQERYSLEDRLCKRPIAIEVDYVVFNATDNLWARASFFKVIAWQPLPAPYKEGE